MLRENLKADRFEVIEYIGAGSFGKVLKAWDKKLEKIVAVKQVRTENNEIPGFLLREISVLKLLKGNPFVVQLLDVVEHTEFDGGLDLLLVMEYVQFDVFKVMRTLKERFSQKLVKTTLYQVLIGLSQLHQNLIMH